MSKFTEEDDALLNELGIEVEVQKTGSRTPREERIIAGFEEIQCFVTENNRLPQHGEERDIFERLYAVRLGSLCRQKECRALLEPLDHQGLLNGSVADSTTYAELDDDDILAALGVDTEEIASNASEVPDITTLRHVRSWKEKQAAEEIAEREKCDDFARFKPLFEQVKEELKTGIRTTRPFVKDAGFSKAEIRTGHFFIVGGQTAYVAEVGETFKAPNGESDARLRVIFANGTESNLLLRSLQRALYADEAGRRITEPDAGPLFTDQVTEDDQKSGTIYVLRSLSEQPVVVENRELLHKIGVTSNDMKKRIANARHDPTFLLADVEIVKMYQLFNIDRIKLENLIHRIFAPARLNIEIKDRFGTPVTPREWFLVPIFAIDEAIERIRNGTITQCVYDPGEAAFRELK